MGPTRQRALLMALRLGLVLLGHLGGCHLVPHQMPVPRSFQASAGPLIAVPPLTLQLSGPWQFAADPAAVGHMQGWGQPDFDDTGWRSVTVPHTWNVMPEYTDYAGIAWYRRRLTLPWIAGEAHVRLRFGAIFYVAQVWWNGVYLGEHEGGYTPFEVDVSALARPGAANVLAVRVDNRRAMDRPPAALPTHWSYDWWHYGGIVRDVALHFSSRGFIAHQRLVAVPEVVIISEYGFAPRWEWIHRRAGADPSEYYAIPPDWARDSEAADRTRQQLIRNQMPVFRSRPFIAGVIFFTYQDHRTPNELMMGVVDAWRQRRGAWAVLREVYAAAVLDAVRLSPASDGTQRAMVLMRARGPIERDLPAYTLRGYRLAWTVAASDGQRQ